MSERFAVRAGRGAALSFDAVRPGIGTLARLLGVVGLGATAYLLGTWLAKPTATAGLALLAIAILCCLLGAAKWRTRRRAFTGARSARARRLFPSGSGLFTKRRRRRADRVVPSTPAPPHKAETATSSSTGSEPEGEVDVAPAAAAEQQGTRLASDDLQPLVRAETPAQESPGGTDSKAEPETPAEPAAPVHAEAPGRLAVQSESPPEAEGTTRPEATAAVDAAAEPQEPAETERPVDTDASAEGQPLTPSEISVEPKKPVTRRHRRKRKRPFT